MASLAPPTLRAPRSCPELPFELWVRIISSVSNSNLIPSLWLSCRRVSRLVRAATEEAFLARHLRPRTRVRFGDLGVTVDRRGRRAYLALALRFARLSKDRARAVFADATPEERLRDRGVYDALLARWRDAMRLYQGDGNGCRNDLPPYTVAVRQIVNDTELPGLEIDYERREISFDWRAMFDMFFGEEQHAMNLNYEARVSRRAPLAMADRATDVFKRKPGGSKANEIQAMIKTGQVELFNGISRMMRIIAERERIAYRDARRLRIRRWYKKHENYELRKGYFDKDYQERQKLKELRIARKYTDYSDESEDDDLPDEDKEAFDQGYGFTRFDVGDPHDEDPYMDWETAQDSDSDDNDPLAEFLNFASQISPQEEAAEAEDSSESYGSLSDSQDMEP
ncbi:hypothetical protein GTA08_BOTSDO02129 [Neofusicoccum parvum]|nr:hypothetical protein GTA08_BOTSDO02129 [Neofusicoccum parvum]